MADSHPDIERGARLIPAERGLSFEPLSPARFLERSRTVFADRTAIVDGDRRISYRDFFDRA